MLQVPELPNLADLTRQYWESRWNVRLSSNDASRYWTGDDTALISQVYEILDGHDASALQAFVSAWSIYRGALSRLQQGPMTATNSTISNSFPASQDSILLEDQLRATSLLQEIAITSIPPRRLLHMHRLWNGSWQQLLSSRRLDFEQAPMARSDAAARDTYHAMARAQTGELFACGFGGAAALAVDDESVAGAVAALGRVYGTLRRAFNDLHHVQTSRDIAPSPQRGQNDPSQSMRLRWYPRILVEELNQVDQHTAVLPVMARAWFLELLADSFIH